MGDVSQDSRSVASLRKIGDRLEELTIQTKLVKLVLANGGHSYKASHAHLAGVLDLVVIHPLVSTVFVEVKVGDLPQRSDTRLSKEHAPTPLQASRIRRIQEAGGWAVWAFCAKIDGSALKCYVSNDPYYLPTKQELLQWMNPIESFLRSILRVTLDPSPRPYRHNDAPTV